MSSDFNQSLVDSLIEEALSDPKAPDRSYGHLGFMEGDLVSSIFSAIQDRVPNETFLKIVKESRENYTSYIVPQKITDLHTVTHNCRKCSFSGINPILPKWNVQNPDVLFILETSNIDQNTSALFISALKDAGFKSENVCLTYLLRCPTKDVQQQYIDNCQSYLHQEIQIMNPKLICPIGGTVLSSLFGTEVKLKDYKSKVTWLGSWPIYPLYSLAYINKAGDSALADFKADMNQAYQFCYKKVANNDSDR